MTLWAIVPLKIVTSSKQRLAGVLTAKQRIQLTLAMAADVLDMLQDCENIDHVLLVSNDSVAADLCQKTTAEWLKPAAQKGLNADLGFACDYAQQKGASACLILHADLPLLRSQALDQLIEQARQKADSAGTNMLAAVPCKEGTGTNLLYTPLPLSMPLVYGKNSFPLFKQQARERDIAFYTLPLQQGDLDVDIPADLEQLRQRLILSDKASAKATRRALTRISQRLALAK